MSEPADKTGHELEEAFGEEDEGFEYVAEQDDGEESDEYELEEERDSKDYGEQEEEEEEDEGYDDEDDEENQGKSSNLTALLLGDPNALEDGEEDEEEDEEDEDDYAEEVQPVTANGKKRSRDDLVEEALSEAPGGKKAKA